MKPNNNEEALEFPQGTRHLNSSNQRTKAPEGRCLSRSMLVSSLELLSVFLFD